MLVAQSGVHDLAERLEMMLSEILELVEPVGLLVENKEGILIASLVVGGVSLLANMYVFYIQFKA